MERNMILILLIGGIRHFTGINSEAYFLSFHSLSDQLE